MTLKEQIKKNSKTLRAFISSHGVPLNTAILLLTIGETLVRGASPVWIAVATVYTLLSINSWLEMRKWYKYEIADFDEHTLRLKTAESMEGMLYMFSLLVVLIFSPGYVTLLYMFFGGITATALRKTYLPYSIAGYLVFEIYDGNKRQYVCTNGYVAKPEDIEKYRNVDGVLVVHQKYINYNKQ